jgi:hypothetical protein
MGIAAPSAGADASPDVAPSCRYGSGAEATGEIAGLGDAIPAPATLAGGESSVDTCSIPAQPVAGRINRTPAMRAARINRSPVRIAGSCGYPPAFKAVPAPQVIAGTCLPSPRSGRQCLHFASCANIYTWRNSPAVGYRCAAGLLPSRRGTHWGHRRPHIPSVALRPLRWIAMPTPQVAPAHHLPANPETRCKWLSAIKTTAHKPIWTS